MTSIHATQTERKKKARRVLDQDEVDENGFLKDIDVQEIKEPRPKTSDKCRDIEQFFGSVVKQTGPDGTSKGYRKCNLCL